MKRAYDYSTKQKYHCAKDVLLFQGSGNNFAVTLSVSWRRFCGVVVITSASHAEGHEFEPRQNLFSPRCYFRTAENTYKSNAAKMCKTFVRTLPSLGHSIVFLNLTGGVTSTVSVVNWFCGAHCTFWCVWTALDAFWMRFSSNYRKWVWNKIIDEDGIRTHARRAEWISSPSP